MRERGFTLIEVLIATAVIALVLGAFVSGAARFADYAGYIRDRNIAQTVANNQMVEFQLARQWPDTGKQDGDTAMGRIRWHWVARIQGSPDPNVRRIDLRVFRVDPDQNQPEADSITLLSGFVVQHIPPQNQPTGNAGAPGSQNPGSPNNGASASGFGSGA